MLVHLATYAFPYLGALALILTGLCIWDDVRNGYLTFSNPFKK